MVPTSRGGGDGIENLTPACRRCNAAKGNQTALEYLLTRKETASTGGRPPVQNPKKAWPTAQAHFTADELRFIDRAAFKLGLTRADYVRKALRRDAAHVLREAAPKDPEA